MRILPFIYLIYMFISTYFLIFFLIIYLRNKDNIFNYPKAKRKYSVSFIVPAYNEEKTIEDTLNHILDINYDGILEVIVVNDCSTDNTRKIVEKLRKKNKKIILINNKKNLGNAARAQNVGLKRAKGEIIAVVDADSFPDRESLKKMIGYFDDEKVGAVTCPILARNQEKFLEKLQSLEYMTISLSRKLLEYVDSIYVNPGPLALYRKKALLEIGGFDEENMTQDIEATWNLIKHGWDRKMSLSTYVTTEVPNKWKEWFLQRRRWNIGGIQCIVKYRKEIFKKGMLGLFIIPFFIIGLFWGVLGIGIFSYLFIKRFISKVLVTAYSIKTNVPLITFEEFYITPSFLNYLGIVLFLAGVIYLLIILAILKVKILKKENLLNIPFYLLIYLTVYPFLLIDAFYNYFKKKKKWM